MKNRSTALYYGALAAAFGIGILAAWLLPARAVAAVEAVLLPLGYFRLLRRR